MNEFEQLNDLSQKLKQKISNFKLNLKEYYKKYDNNSKKILYEYFEIIKDKNIFLDNLDFSLPVIPEIDSENIFYEKMNEKLNENSNEKLNEIYQNLFIPIINYDNEKKKLKCSFDTLELNLRTFPYLYENIYTINIISYINENINISLGKYREEKNLVRDIIKEKIVEKEGEKDNNYLTFKNNEVKKGENIQLLVRIPESIEEEKYTLSGILKIKTDSNIKLEGPKIKIILTIIPISILFSCKEYKLLYIKAHEEYKENFQFQHYFKLDTNVLIEKEELHFELLNYRDKDLIDFYISAKPLTDNTSPKPRFESEPRKKKM